MWQPTKLELERLDKAKRLQALGVELYPARAGRSHRVADAVRAFLKQEEQMAAGGSDAAAPIAVTVAGRIRRLNSKGKVSFAHIEDERRARAALPARKRLRARRPTNKCGAN